jgi:arylsulfatase A-like enzyme
MTSGNTRVDDAGLTGSSSASRAGDRLGPISILVLSAWCGLVAGLLEMTAVHARKRFFDPNHFYGMSRQFVWMVPLADLLIFLVLGLILSLVVRFGARGRRIAPWALGTLAFLPPFWAAFPRVYGPALLVLAAGLAARLVPALERRAVGFGRLVRLTFPISAGLVMILAAWCWAQDQLEQRREASRPLPPPFSPNILLIVLDTVGAGHLSLHGYERPTSPTLDELASRGVCFKAANVTTSWTLPSHASMFTGRWPHELSAGWFTPLDSAFPTLAEHLGAHGYATGGFAANLAYCAYDSGLARGFATYRDFVYPELTMLHLTAMVSRVVDGIQGVESLTNFALGVPLLRSPADFVWRLFGHGRKNAAVINREFLDWLAEPGRRDRPFFAFVNFFDAHYPYDLPAGAIHRFGTVPRNERETTVLRDWIEITRQGPSERQIAFARNAYDDGIASLDEQLGELIDELERRGLLERTWVIITSDHGESFGEHPGVFVHGTTLFQTERHVPLVVIPPGGAPSPRVVTEPVSLRDLAATIVDISGCQAGSRFPGISLARFWDGTTAAELSSHARSSPALSELAPEGPLYSARAEPNARLWPLAALIDGDWSYMRREKDSLELLFNLREDAGEIRNLAGEPAVRPILDRMRNVLSSLTAGPLTPDRFNP